MANTSVHSTTQVDQFRKQYFKEYVRESGFKESMGKDMNAVIQLVTDLTKKPGDQITVNLVKKLSGAGVTGDSTLEGNEEALANYGHQLTVDQLRNAVRLGRMESQKTGIPLLEAARAMLKLWSMDNLRDSIITALYSPALDGSSYATATEAEKDAWLDANTDRILFGNAVGNLDQTAPAGGATNDHSGSLSNVDSTSDKFTSASVSLMKRRCKTATNGNIRPIRTTDGEWFVCYAGSLPFRDLKEDLKATNRDGWVRGKSNPIFKDGDLLYDGVIIKEVPEIGVISGVGASSIDVGAVFMCGAQAVGIAWADMPGFATEEFDYGNLKGVAVKEIRAVEKLMFNDVQNGVHTGYFSAVADA